MRNLLILMSVLLLNGAPLDAAVPQLISAQGKLTDQQGAPLLSGNYSITFVIYDAPTGGGVKWTETNPLVNVADGQFNVLLGSINSIDDSVFAGVERYLGVRVGEDPEMTPRSRLVSVGYAQRVGTVDGASGGTVDGPVVVQRYSPVDGEATLTIKHHSNYAQPNQTAFEVIGGVTDLNPKSFRLFTDRGDPWNLHALLEGDLRMGEQPLGNGIGYAVLGSYWLDYVSSYGATTGDMGIHVFGNYDNDALDAQASLSLSFGRQDGGDYWNGRPYFFDISQFGTSRLHITSQGAIGIGTRTPNVDLEVKGTLATDVLEIRGGSDLAEPFESSDGISFEPGFVVSIDDLNAGKLMLSIEPYDKKVAGVVSGAGGVRPGLTLKQEGVTEGDNIVALSGRVYVHATASNGPIRPGDRLTTSGVHGYAMKVTDSSRADGAVIGKAMSGLESGEGLVLVLVNLQ